MSTDTEPLDTPAASTVVFVHLSDIHFSKPVETGLSYTPDEDIRHELKRDAGLLLERQGIEKAHFVLVTGDIAFSGDKEEYRRADQWLGELCDRVRCEPENVRTIPGNHDVQRRVVDESQSIQDGHAGLRTAKLSEIDQKLDRYFADKGLDNLLFRALQNYQNFAAKYGGSFDNESPYLQYDILLNDLSTLRIRSLNSTLVSDRTDDRNANRLVVGSNTCLLMNEEGVEYLVMCHHPPDWLHDGNELTSRIDSRARMALFGHKHVQRIIKHTTPNGHESLWLHAGAVNPEASEQYQPRYNVLEISIVTLEGKRLMRVVVHRRVWDGESQVFADASDGSGGPRHEFFLNVPPWTPPASPPVRAVMVSPAEGVQGPLQIPSDPLNVSGDDANRARMNAVRHLAYRFLALPYHKRMLVAQALQLLRDEDQDIADPELSNRFFQRAKEREQMADFWQQVEQAHGAQLGSNPFRST